MAEIVAEEGVIQKSEYKIIKNLLRFHTICAKDVMTPRTVVVAAEQHQSVGELFEKIKTLRFTRIPIFEGSKDRALLEKRQQIAMVVDAYGGMSGILTMEDVLETLLGLEIVDEFDRTVDMQKLAREIWEKRARERGLG